MSSILHYYKAQGYVPVFGNRSLSNLHSCDSDLQTVAHQVISWGFDISIVYGHRTEHEQNACYDNKTSTNCWPDSRHNSLPSEAMDIAPYFSSRDPRNVNIGIPWDKKFHPDFLRPWFVLHGVILAACEINNIELDWGGHWKKLKDYPHYQTKK